MIVTCVSDLHGYKPELKGGDLLIVAGDLTATDKEYQHMEFCDWLDMQPFHKKVVIAGNHDNNVNPLYIDTLRNCHYLQDSEIRYCGLKIWGSPWTKVFPGMNPCCMAFTLRSTGELSAKWALIPDDTDILVTHSPAFGSFDTVERYWDDFSDKSIENCGCPALCRWIANHVNTLKLHVCGHIHQGWGIYDIREHQYKLKDKYTTVLVNASYVDEHYRPLNNPITVIL